ncbi:PREDICTED: uncharacterized protein LOC104728885 [Camelina sativa]|uniref:Uncharacterized protein LOC104728885 n=1 Tax=Camelina sativa TaxID=90675 RepID=A0ABM0UTI9_CAMSA|nr:PREDICTED: uncharacterized protein LOC104728885 [Camelina sativa]
MTNRQSINTIKEVVCPDGRIAATEDAVKAEAERHFREFLQLVPSDFEGSRVEDLEQLLPFRCSDLDVQQLTRTVTGVEIKKVLFSMPNDKSPWPDGFTAEFYKAAWGLIGTEFVLAKVLTAMCFPPTFVHWIMLCVTTASFSVQVNGDLVGYFRSSRGLRQGFSLSPYLFVICMEVLTKLLDKAAGARRFGYHPRCKNLGLTYLSFANDLMVLSDGKERYVEGIVAVFDEFVKLSGLKISMEKSTLFLAGVPASTADQISTWFSFAHGQFPIRYLGLPLITKKLTNADLAPLLEQLQQRIGSWTVRTLSFAGRLNLISSVLWSTLSDTTTRGSWIWRKLLKYRDMAKPLCNMVVGNGEKTSFWYDNWSPMNRLMDIGGDRGVIDMGISKQSTLAEVWDTHRRRRHRLPHLNDMEDALHTQRLQRRDVPDSLHWKGKNDMFRSGFSTRDTWNHIRTTSNVVAWHKGVWFAHAVPKYSFCVWLAALNKLSTGDHMLCWNRDTDGTCVLCHSDLETRNHLFFSCHYATEVWAALAKGLFCIQYTTDWETNLTSISNQQQSRVEAFLQRCVFQVVVYTLWRERNGRRHGEASTPSHYLIDWADKQIKTQITAIGKMGIDTIMKHIKFGYNLDWFRLI